MAPTWGSFFRNHPRQRRGTPHGGLFRYHPRRPRVTLQGGLSRSHSPKRRRPPPEVASSEIIPGNVVTPPRVASSEFIPSNVRRPNVDDNTGGSTCRRTNRCSPGTLTTQGHQTGHSGELRSVGPEPSPCVQPKSPITGIDISFALDENEYGRAAFGDLAVRAYHGLNGCTLQVEKNGGLVEVKVPPEQARRLIGIFFSEILGNTLNRVGDVFARVEAYNATYGAEEEDEEETNATAPSAIRQLARALSKIPKKTKADTASVLVYKLATVQVRQCWEEIQASLNASSSSSSSIAYIEYLGLRPPFEPAGLLTSRAKDAICKRASIPISRFRDIWSKATIPIALAEHFGPGSLLFFDHRWR